MSKHALAIVAFGVAALFFALAVLTVDIGDLNEIAAGLLALTAGFLIERLP